LRAVIAHHKRGGTDRCALFLVLFKYCFVSCRGLCSRAALKEGEITSCEEE
jgi:hypothetical protein